MSNEEFGGLIWKFGRSLVRLETLDSYAVPSDDALYSAFLDGKPLPAKMPNEWEEWFEKVRLATSSGKEMVRIHTIPRELTPYLRYEIEWAYRYFNQPNGEKVFLLVREDNPKLMSDSRAREDFYILDDEKLVFVNYDKENRWVGLEIQEDRSLIRSYQEYVGKLRQNAMSLDQFMVELRNSTLTVHPKS